MAETKSTSRSGSKLNLNESTMPLLDEEAHEKAETPEKDVIEMKEKASTTSEGEKDDSNPEKIVSYYHSVDCVIKKKIERFVCVCVCVCFYWHCRENEQIDILCLNWSVLFTYLVFVCVCVTDSSMICWTGGRREEGWRWWQEKEEEGKEGEKREEGKDVPSQNAELRPDFHRRP